MLALEQIPRCHWSSESLDSEVRLLFLTSDSKDSELQQEYQNL